MSKPPGGGGSGGGSGGSQGNHITANPNDYLLSEDITLADGSVLSAGTRWYQVPDVERLRSELAQGTYNGDPVWGEKIVFGYDIMTKTYQMLGPNRTDGRAPLYTGQIMNCSACHAQGGTVPHAWPLFRTATHFGLRQDLNHPPQAGEGELYSSLGYWRDTITVNRDCGINCAGQGEIPKDSYEMDGLVAWTYAVRDGIYPGEGLIGAFKLPENVTKIPGARIPIFASVLGDQNFAADPAAGKVAYDRSCASCHGKEGLGKWSSKSGYTVPPVAGGGSHTKAGGPYMATVLAAFIKRQMPLSQPNSLTERQAIDIAAYISDLGRESRWWEDYYYEHNPCARPAYLPLDVGATPAGFPFTEADTRYGPWKPISDWLKSAACTGNPANEILTPLLPEDFDAGFNGVDFVKPAGIPPVRR
ncbi:MAG: c-type cytochrome [Gammaproteobacteria bacterium]